MLLALQPLAVLCLDDSCESTPQQLSLQRKLQSQCMRSDV